uniref:Uncharacterized protein n=1 Tax=Meloidogyne javanica TaxID=6303 RepID=A0A915MZQ8_MELJA
MTRSQTKALGLTLDKDGNQIPNSRDTEGRINFLEEEEETDIASQNNHTIRENSQNHLQISDNMSRNLEELEQEILDGDDISLGEAAFDQENVVKLIGEPENVMAADLPEN